MILYPAIDLRHGRCVRLRQGRPQDEIVYDGDPAAVARRWVAEGAAWLHVVNLDGALGEGDLPLNLLRLAEIHQAAPGTPIQFGGGLRSLADVERALALGASRVVLGTAAVYQPHLVDEAVGRFGAERIVAGIDARDGWVATHGWQETTAVTASDLGRAVRTAGVVRAVYTDISRDGMLAGANVEATAALARATGLRLIASGGVASLADVQRLCAHAADGIEGVIVGRALYSGALSLAEAIRVAQDWTA
jgi:phosphoribosylformimino-5-aminoimidazole carboxamide ribotide isomerase